MREDADIDTARGLVSGVVKFMVIFTSLDRALFSNQARRCDATAHAFASANTEKLRGVRSLRQMKIIPS